MKHYLGGVREKMKDGRKIRNKRLSIIGAEGIFKGIRFTPVSDSGSPKRISFKIEPCVGVKNSDEGLTGMVMPKVNTKFIYFNNETSEITSEDAMFVYAGKTD